MVAGIDMFARFVFDHTHDDHRLMGPATWQYFQKASTERSKSSGQPLCVNRYRSSGRSGQFPLRDQYGYRPLEHEPRNSEKTESK